MAVVVKRLFCLDLQTAGLVIGYLGGFFVLCEIIELLSTIANINDYFDVKQKEQKSTARALLLILLLVSLLDMLSSVLLIHGTNKRSHKLLLPWLTIKGIALAFLIPLMPLGIIVGIHFIVNGFGSKLLVSSVLLIILVVLYSYIYMVIYSLYYFIRNDLQTPQQIDSENLYSNSNKQHNRT